MLPNSCNCKRRCLYNAKSHAKVQIIFYIRKCAREKNRRKCLKSPKIALSCHFLFFRPPVDFHLSMRHIAWFCLVRKWWTLKKSTQLRNSPIWPRKGDLRLVERTKYAREGRWTDSNRWIKRVRYIIKFFKKLPFLQSVHYKIKSFCRFLAFFSSKIWSYCRKAVILHRVFHGIRFKVK